MAVKTIGVIGLGSIGLRHAKNLIELGCEVYGFDPEPGRIALLIHAGGKHKPEWEEAYRPDAVVVATPTSEHVNTALPYLGFCPVFMEKPIADRSLGILEKVVMVGNNLRFHPAVKQCKAWLDDRIIGDVLWASLTCAQHNDRPAYLRDGVILNWGAHEVDLALHLFGPAQITAASANEDDSIADIILVHSYTGIRSTIHLDYVTRPELRQTRIVGTSGGIEINLPGRTAVAIRPDGKVIEFHEYNGSYDDDYKEEMRVFLDRVDGKFLPTDPGATGLEGIECLELLLAAKRKAGLA